MRHSIRLISVCCILSLCSGCVKPNTGITDVTAESENTPIPEERGILVSIVDSLLKVYPKTFENPIQKTDFLSALAESLNRLSQTELNEMAEQIPFKLYQVQNVPNQPGGKYLTAFEFSRHYNIEQEQEGEYGTVDLGYSIKICGFAALDKATASQMEKHMDYTLSGKMKIIEVPTIGGWDDRTIKLGFDLTDASIK